MNNWHSFLHQQGATLLEQNRLSFNEKPGNYPNLQQQNTMTPLINLGVLSVNGADSVRFLQGQVTCDVEQLSAEHSLIGARCNPKGRALSSFRLVQASDDQLLMIMDHSLLQSSIDDLSKFAAFFKVQLTDASEQYHCIGLTGQHSTLNTSTLVTKKIITSQISDNRQLLIIPDDQAETLWLSLTKRTTPVGTEFWELQDIKNGIANVQLETSAMFIPQMLNLQAIDAISFKKGCYTGQEVVARMKYLGKIKRRMYRIAVMGDTVSVNALPSPGTSCQLPNQKQSIGNVVAAANADKDLQEILVVLTDEAAQSKALIIGTEHHKKVERLLLPYEI